MTTPEHNLFIDSSLRSTIFGSEGLSEGLLNGRTTKFLFIATAAAGITSLAFDYVNGNHKLSDAWNAAAEVPEHTDETEPPRE